MRFQDPTGDDPVAFPDSTCTHETDKALKVDVGGDLLETKWIPKSVLHRDSEVNTDGDTGVLVIKKWFARKEAMFDG